jgi:hypothetical protein
MAEETALCRAGLLKIIVPIGGADWDSMLSVAVSGMVSGMSFVSLTIFAGKDYRQTASSYQS